MAFIHGKYTTVAYKDADLTTYFNSTSRTSNAEQADSTTYGRGHKSYLAGVQDGSLSIGGLFDGSTKAIDDYLSNTLGSPVNAPITVALAQLPVVGSSAILASAVCTSYEVSSPVSDVVSANAEFVADGGIHSGFLIHPKSVAITATGNGTSVDQVVATTNNGWIANLHVVANTMNNTTTFDVEDSPDGITWTNLGTFATVPATTTKFQTLLFFNTTVHRYIRLVRTVAGTGSLTAIVSFARIH